MDRKLARWHISINGLHIATIAVFNTTQHPREVIENWVGQTMRPIEMSMSLLWYTVPYSVYNSVRQGIFSTNLKIQGRAHLEHLGLTVVFLSWQKRWRWTIFTTPKLHWTRKWHWLASNHHKKRNSILGGRGCHLHSMWATMTDLLDDHRRYVVVTSLWKRPTSSYTSVKLCMWTYLLHFYHLQYRHQFRTPI